jgi:hypothetical protein
MNGNGVSDVCTREQGVAFRHRSSNLFAGRGLCPSCRVYASRLVYILQHRGPRGGHTAEDKRQRRNKIFFCNALSNHANSWIIRQRWPVAGHATCLAFTPRARPRSETSWDFERKKGVK